VSTKRTNHFEEIICANQDCNNSFIPKTYNSIFCSPECRRVATNKKLLEKYYENKSNKNKKRTCKTANCATILSRYNKEDICESCKRERYVKRLVSWGWSESDVRKGLE
jgi:hypothetical protein